jgi:hypothetical protein
METNIMTSNNQSYESTMTNDLWILSEQRPDFLESCTMWIKTDKTIKGYFAHDKKHSWVEFDLITMQAVDQKTWPGISCQFKPALKNHSGESKPLAKVELTHDPIPTTRTPWQFPNEKIMPDSTVNHHVGTIDKELNVIKLDKIDNGFANITFNGEVIAQWFKLGKKSDFYLRDINNTQSEEVKFSNDKILPIQAALMHLQHKLKVLDNLESTLKIGSLIIGNVTVFCLPKTKEKFEFLINVLGNGQLISSSDKGNIDLSGTRYLIKQNINVPIPFVSPIEKFIQIVMKPREFYAFMEMGNVYGTQVLYSKDEAITAIQNTRKNGFIKWTFSENSYYELIEHVSQDGFMRVAKITKINRDHVMDLFFNNIAIAWDVNRLPVIEQPESPKLQPVKPWVPFEDKSESPKVETPMPVVETPIVPSQPESIHETMPRQQAKSVQIWGKYGYIRHAFIMRREENLLIVDNGGSGEDILKIDGHMITGENETYATILRGEYLPESPKVETLMPVIETPIVPSKPKTVDLTQLIDMVKAYNKGGLTIKRACEVVERMATESDYQALLSHFGLANMPKIETPKVDSAPIAHAPIAEPSETPKLPHILPIPFINLKIERNKAIQNPRLYCFNILSNDELIGSITKFLGPWEVSIKGKASQSFASMSHAESYVMGLMA